MMLHFFDENGYFVESSEARLDPAVAKKGKVRWLVPKNATLAELPLEEPGFRHKFTDTEWIQEAIIPDNFTITITKKVEYYALSNELEQAGIKFTRTDNVLTVTMPATQKNQDTVDAVIAAHDFVVAIKAKRQEEIAYELVEIDKASVPYLRKFCTGTHTVADIEELAKKEADVVRLKEELSAISVVKIIR